MPTRVSKSTTPADGKSVSMDTTPATVNGHGTVAEIEKSVIDYVASSNTSQVKLTESLAALYRLAAWDTHSMTLPVYWSSVLHIGGTDDAGDVVGFVLSKPAAIALIKELPKVSGRDMSVMTGVASASVKRYRKEAGVISADRSNAQPAAGTSGRPGSAPKPAKSAKPESAKAKSDRERKEAEKEATRKLTRDNRIAANLTDDQLLIKLRNCDVPHVAGLLRQRFNARELAALASELSPAKVPAPRVRATRTAGQQRQLQSV